ncbi:NINE protein [Akkermansia sp. N21116]|uniref:TM2 domain-containing protein n=1 Tax=Akkermansia sp. N21116 TaxID=3040764 RepID=UPI00244EEDFF|nr:TM2 domain-containing protein [Akkermansia sp. N21116]WPX39890.1 NINE protein [Akkermansia sp. N21116]
MKCEYCNNAIPAGVAKCPSCGAPAPEQVVAESAPTPTQMPASGQPQIVIQVQQPQQVMPTTLPKSRTAYVVLAIFLGCFGIHNFYAGYTGRAITQLVITLLIGWFGFAFFIWIWAIIEAIVVKQDAKGVPFS